MTTIPSVLITGASTGIGAAYAERFARRGHDLVLVARDMARMEALGARLRQESDVAIDIIQADLTKADELARVETRLRDDARVGILVNNAGANVGGSFIEQATDDVARIVALNTTALLRLASAVAPRLAEAGDGAIINIGSVVGLAPEFGMTVYGATKAFVLFLSQGLSLELAPKGVYVQAVLPAATRTEIRERSGTDINTLPAVMEVDELVDAALVGFDRRELVTIPPLPDAGQWDALQAARQVMIPGFAQVHAAERYSHEHRCQAHDVLDDDAVGLNRDGLAGVGRASEFEKGAESSHPCRLGWRGNFAIQLAKHLGATVATTTSTANVDLVKRLGADVVIDYKKERLREDPVRLRRRPEQPGRRHASKIPECAEARWQADLDLRSAGPRFSQRTRTELALAAGLAPFELQHRRKAKGRGVSYSFLFMRANGAQLSQITSLIEAGIIRPAMDRVFPSKRPMKLWLTSKRDAQKARSSSS